MRNDRPVESELETIDLARRKQSFMWIDIDATRYMGFVLDASPALLFVKRVEEFVPMGYVVLRRSAVESVDLDLPNITFADSFLRREGLGPSQVDPIIDLSSMTTALNSMQKLSSMVSAERQSSEHDDRCDMLVGEISSVDDLRLRIRHVSTIGDRDADETEMLVHEIIIVEFDSPYLKAFQRHVFDR